jgi:hypothetical protein
MIWTDSAINADDKTEKLQSDRWTFLYTNRGSDADKIVPLSEHLQAV